VAVIGERLGGWVTRCDLAVDYWAGIDGGMSGLEPSYLAGDMDVRGKRPKVAHAGDWINRRACTFYLGSREAGKYTRVYLKGDQLFGLDAGDKWTRVELQWGDQLRVLPWAMLQKPAEYFAGASDWHASMLHQAGAQTVSPEKVACTPAAAGMTVQAEAFRNLSWLFRTARASIASAFRFRAVCPDSKIRKSRLAMHKLLPSFSMVC
jgi:phage replication initiation protein